MIQEMLYLSNTNGYIITIKNYNILLSISDETTNENIHLVVLMEVDAS